MAASAPHRTDSRIAASGTPRDSAHLWSVAQYVLDPECSVNLRPCQFHLGPDSRPASAWQQEYRVEGEAAPQPALPRSRIARFTGWALRIQESRILDLKLLTYFGQLEVSSSPAPGSR
jgi:hypothetical protein